MPTESESTLVKDRHAAPHRRTSLQVNGQGARPRWYPSAHPCGHMCSWGQTRTTHKVMGPPSLTQLFTSGSHSEVPVLAASASPESLLEMQILSLYLRLPNREF